MTHEPDKIIGAAPVSGYSSIQGQQSNLSSLWQSPDSREALTVAAYVSYHFWHESDPKITAVIQSSLSDFRHEMLLENSCGIPVHQQHGSLDDNVPPSHSRRLHLLLSLVGCPSKYVELPGKGHWFEGIMTTQSLLDFYDRILEDEATERSMPSSFDFVVVNPATTGSKRGVVVDQLVSPGSLGRVRAKYEAVANNWRLQTSNVQRLHFTTDATDDWSSSEITIDGSRIQMLEHVPISRQWIVRSKDGSWKVWQALLWQ